MAPAPALTSQQGHISTGRDLTATKIDEARWPREAGPTTVKTVSYWLFVP